MDRRTGRLLNSVVHSGVELRPDQAIECSQQWSREGVSPTTSSPEKQAWIASGSLWLEKQSTVAECQWPKVGGKTDMTRRNFKHPGRNRRIFSSRSGNSYYAGPAWGPVNCGQSMMLSPGLNANYPSLHQQPPAAGSYPKRAKLVTLCLGTDPRTECNRCTTQCLVHDA